MSIHDNIAARTAALVSAAPADPVPDAESASTANGARPPPTAAGGADSASGAAPDETAAGNSPAGPGEQSPPEAPKTEHELLAEKLAAVRQANRERREFAAGARAREQAEREAARIRAEAQAEREAAAKERAEIAAGRKDYKKFFEANGLNPREAYEEMTRQAIEAGTPEGQLRAAQEGWKAEMESLRGEVKSLREEREQARREAEEHAKATAFRSDYDEALKLADYSALRDAYDDDALLEKAALLRDNPEAFYANAKRYGVRLTSPAEGYRMTDILNVLAAADAAYEETRAKRRAARTAASPPTAAPQAAPTASTVNGTTERRNAGTSTVGNDLATQRASDGKFLPKGRTAAERLRERVRRLSG